VGETGWAGPPGEPYCPDKRLALGWQGAFVLFVQPRKQERYLESLQPVGHSELSSKNDSSHKTSLSYGFLINS
jgi:hypothetical protein